MANEELRRLVLEASRTYAGTVCIGVITVAQADAILEAIKAAGYVLVPTDRMERLVNIAYCANVHWEDGEKDKECPHPDEWGESPPAGLLLGIALSFLEPGDLDQEDEVGE
jgi:hypothetical protein